jgi:hypothetical protein
MRVPNQNSVCILCVLFLSRAYIYIYVTPIHTTCPVNDSLLDVTILTTIGGLDKS